MSIPTPNPKERLALLRFEVICHIKTLRQDGQPLALCLRDAASRPWPGEEGKYYSFRTIETWWYDYTSRGYQGLTGKSARTDAGKSRSIDEELGLWLLDAVAKSPNTPLSVLYRHWDEHGRELPSLSSVQRFLASRGYDRRTLKAGRLESGPQKAFEAPAPNDLWMVDFACGPTLRSAEGKSTVLKSWMAALEPKRFLPLLITQASLSVTGVLEIILAKLGERPRFKRSTNLLVLEKHLAELDPVTLDLLAQSAWFIAARAHASSIEPDHVHQAIKLIPSAHDKIIHP
jgi:hypothetical protein